MLRRGLAAAMTDERFILVLRYCRPERTWDRELTFNRRLQCWELRHLRVL